MPSKAKKPEQVEVELEITDPHQTMELDDIIQTMQDRVDEIRIIEEQANNRLDNLESVHRSWQHERRELNKKIENWNKMLHRYDAERWDTREKTERMLEKASNRVFAFNMTVACMVIVFCVVEGWHMLYRWVLG